MFAAWRMRRTSTPTPTLPRLRGRGRAGVLRRAPLPRASPACGGGQGEGKRRPRRAGSNGGAPRDLPNRVLYRDGLVLVIDKPAGIPVHAGPGGGPHLEHWFPLLRFGLPRPPALAHRLDRDTSGCLVLGRHPKALRRLGRLFAEGQGREGVLGGRRRRAGRSREGRIEVALAKQPRGTVGWRMVAGPGRPACDHRLPRARRGGRPRLARTAAAHRPHPPDPGALRRARLPGGRRSDIWRPGRRGAAAARPLDRAAALPGEAADRGDRAGAAAYARWRCVRLGYDPGRRTEFPPASGEPIPA